jgi:glutamate-5-semialdehyde dehydrogenase
MTDSILPRLQEARAAGRILAATPASARSAALVAIASELRAATGQLLDANAVDVARAENAGTDPAFIDRLRLTPERIEEMANAVQNIAAAPDPIGRSEGDQIQPNGLRVARVRIPLGVVGVIYEARPNVTSDAAALALRSGNAIVLRGGSDARSSNEAIGAIVERAVVASGLPPASVTLLTAAGREQISELLQASEFVDVIIPRGGEGLIRNVRENSRIPVISHYKGVCHVYVDKHAELEMARRIVVNAKASRVSVCNSAETLLIHSDVAATMLPEIAADLFASGVTLHACPRSMEIIGPNDAVVPATEDDWHAEYLSLDLAVRVVDSVQDAVQHIATYGSDHTEAIISDSVAAVQEFTTYVQSSCVVVNASTRFADGGQLGLGAEIGISTSKMHAYGPMGAEGLTTLRFVVTGSGQVR